MPIPFRVRLLSLLSCFFGTWALTDLLSRPVRDGWFFDGNLFLLPLGIALLYGFSDAVRCAKFGIVVLAGLSVVAGALLASAGAESVTAPWFGRTLAGTPALLLWIGILTLHLAVLTLLFRQFDAPVWRTFVRDREAQRARRERVRIPWKTVGLVGLAAFALHFAYDFVVARGESAAEQAAQQAEKAIAFPFEIALSARDAKTGEPVLYMGFKVPGNSHPGSLQDVWTSPRREGGLVGGMASGSLRIGIFADGYKESTFLITPENRHLKSAVLSLKPEPAVVP